MNKNEAYTKLMGSSKWHYAKLYLANKEVPERIKNAPAFKAFCTKIQRGTL